LERIVYHTDRRTFRVKHGSISFKVCTPNSLCLSRVRSFSSKEPETLEWIDAFSENSIFWDIGANIGLFSLYAHLRKNAQVVAFEPSVFNQRILLENVNLNNIQSGSIIYHPLPVSGETEVNAFQLSNMDVGGAKSAFGVNYGHDGKTLNALFRYSILSQTLDEIVDFNNFDQPDYIKIDVDGIEHLILEGAKKTLQNTKSVLVEINDEFLEQTERASVFLESLGFVLLKKSHAPMFDYADDASRHTFNQIWINPHRNLEGAFEAK